MKTKSIVAALMAVSALTSIPAFAQPNDWRGAGAHDNRRDSYIQTYGQQNRQARDFEIKRYENRKEAQWHDNRSIRRFDNDRDHYRPVYNTRRDWREGQYLPRHYRERQFVINNWREYNLYAPPRGYYWVDAGSDFVLAAIATNLIMHIVHR